MNIAVLTSGGDSPGMNAAIRSIVKFGIKNNISIYGIKYGYLGLYQNQINLLKLEDVENIIKMGGTFLGTSRFIEFIENTNIIKKSVQNLKNKDISFLIIIGGNGSYKGALKLIDFGVKCIGIPGTIDNDITGTEFTIGFHTALNTIVEAIDKIKDTSKSHKRCTLVEVMGRHKGDLALYSSICNETNLVIVPEYNNSKIDVLKKMKSFRNKEQSHAIVILTERQFDINVLAKEIELVSGLETKITILGHTQKGGNPLPQDRILGTLMGFYSIEMIKKNFFNIALGIRNNKIIPYSFSEVLENKKDDIFQSLWEINNKLI
ncbi:MAG: ATP-dependent 6-phosphofructokinase [Candidatus Phytoplasma pyri]